MSNNYRRLLAAALTCAATLTASTTVALAQPAGFSSQMPSPVIDHLGRPVPSVLDAAQALADQPPVPLPEQARQALSAAVGFFRGEGTPGADIPDGPDTPRIVQFGWPTAAPNCIDGTHQAVGTAIAVPGPAALPLPGVKSGEVAFVFTALGTPAAAKHQNFPLTVHWFNTTTGASGVTALENTELNPNGPATVMGTAATGNGTVVAFLSGSVTTGADQGAQIQCTFAPTAAYVEVR